MTHYLRTGTKTTVISDADLKVDKQLTARNYILDQTTTGEFFLKDTEPFVRPSRYYGDVESRAQRVLHTFQSRPRSTGVLLQGLPGTGKTLLAREISLMGAEQNIPTILINQEFYGDPFCAFIASINQPCIIIFDEFEKIYERDAQNKVLTLFDGTYTQKKLFLVTVNDSYNLISPFLNRPGRLYYRFNYEGLDAAFINEYVTENLVNSANQSDLLDYMSGVYVGISFDALSSVVEEMNRYDLTASDALRTMNIEPTSTTEIEILITSDSHINMRCIQHHTGNMFTAKEFGFKIEGMNKEGEVNIDWIYPSIGDVVSFDKKTGVIHMKYSDEPFINMNILLRQTSTKKFATVGDMF